MRVLCTHPNASENINGVPFTAVPGGMLSEPIDAETGAHFLRIPGYSEWVEPSPESSTEQPARRPRSKP